jgi:hypothetical protein
LGKEIQVASAAWVAQVAVVLVELVRLVLRKETATVATAVMDFQVP